eukprot:jgi/Psemu1/22686/gm1.22686_g
MPRQISNAGASLSLSASASSSATTTTAAGTTATAKKAFLLAAVCASLSSNQHAADAFAVPPLLSSARRSSSSFWKAPSSSSSTAVVVSSSPNDDREYFFTAPTPQRQRQLSNNNNNNNNNNGAIDTTATAKTFAKRSNSNTIKSAEQSELERMGVADRAHRDNDDIDPEFLESITTQASSVPQTTLSVLSSSTPAATPAAPPTAVAAAVPMNVDGNGTGALMNRSHAAGGAHAPLMVTSYNPRDYPIDSGRDGMHAPKISTTKQPLSRSNDDIVDPTRPGVRLVRYKVQSQQQQQQQEPSQGPTRSETNLVLASALVKNNNNNNNNANANANTNTNNNNNNNNNQDGTQSRTLAARPNHKPRRILIKKPKTPPATTITTPTTTAIARYSYNGPDIDSTTDHDGMETPAVQQKRNRMLKLRTANLVRYNGASQQQRLETPAAPADHSNSNNNSNTTTEQQPPPTETKQKKAQKDGGRKTLADDVGYANRYTGLTDFTLAKKTGLAVNKPISLWVERDKFL